MLTRKQYELLRFINERLKEAGVPPSFDEMKDALDLRSKSGIHRLITALEERGFIRRLPNRARAIEVIKLPEAKRGFVLLPRRWVVERSFAWAARFRRLARDYERLPETLAGLHFLAFAILMLKRLVEVLAQSS